MHSPKSQRGFTLIELMIVVAILGVLAAIGVPLFMSYMRKAKVGEAELMLNAIAKSAKIYYQTSVQYPQGTAAVLPAADGTACTETSRKMAPTDDWTTDPVWSALDFGIQEDALFSYHYESSDSTTAEVLAVGDLDCDGTLMTYRLSLSAPTGSPTAELFPPAPGSD